MTKHYCDICSANIPERHKRAIFVEPGRFGAVCEMDFCDNCYKILTGSKFIQLKKTQQDISNMELTISDEREDKPEEKPEEVKLHKPVIKMGRPLKEKPEPLPEPDEPEEQDSKKPIDYGKMLALYRAGWKIPDIADDLHCGTSTVYKYIQICKKEGRL